MTTRIVGPRTWSMTRDTEGHRDYKLTMLTESDTALDGPSRHLLTPGLPVPGSVWLIDNEIDIWAWCRWDTSVTPIVKNEPNKQFELVYTFSTKPPKTGNGQKGCKETQVEDPLLEPIKVSGGSSKYQEEAIRDRFGTLIRNSSYEQVRGPQVEFDKNRDTVRIEKNVPVLGADVWGPMRDTLNMFPLWGFPARCVKLSGVTWEKKFYGNCFPYYTITYEFETYVKISETTGSLTSGFDREIMDEGNKVLTGRQDPARGTGALIAITAINAAGGISSATLSPIDQGSGYPRNTYVPLFVKPDSNSGVNGKGGVVILKTDSAGVGSRIAWVHKGGSGYVATGSSNVVTYQRGGWVLYPEAIVNTNPQNYCQYKDKGGENTKAVLDGAGLPIGEDPADTPGTIVVQKYGESNFLLLGVPIIL